MMALQHTLLGTALGIASSPVLESAPAEQRVAWVAVWGAFALWPDLDHTQSTVSRMWGPITGGYRARVWGRRRRLAPGLTDVIGWVSGGHRKGTHSVLAIAVMLAAVWLASWSRVGTVMVVVFGTGLVVAAGLVLAGRSPRRYVAVNVAASGFAGWAAWTNHWVLPNWVPWAMAGGVAAHILGDMLTKEGCPLNWPWSSTPSNVSLMPVEAGGPFERWIYRPVLVVANALPLAYMAGFHPIGAVWDVAVTTWSNR